MGLIHIKEKGGDQEYRFKNALKMAKAAIDEIRELSDEMEEQYGERHGGYRSRGYDRGYDHGWDGMEERRDSRGRFM